MSLYWGSEVNMQKAVTQAWPNDFSYSKLVFMLGRLHCKANSLQFLLNMVRALYEMRRVKISEHPPCWLDWSRASWNTSLQDVMNSSYCSHVTVTNLKNHVGTESCKLNAVQIPEYFGIQQRCIDSGSRRGNDFHASVLTYAARLSPDSPSLTSPG